MAVRRNIRGLTDDQLNQLRAAFGAMQAIPDERGYHFFAGMHGLPLPSYCAHGSLLFLPWHRAYLYFFELYLQDIAANANVQNASDIGISWWDWTSNASHTNGLPPAYTAAQIEGTDNPLAIATVEWPIQLVQDVVQALPGTLTAQGRTLRDPDEPDELPRRSTIESILTLPTFTSFSTALENVHGDVHVWIGGTMTQVATAAYDPIFWPHHSMIDRLWHMWQLRHPGLTPPVSIMNIALSPFPMTVAQTFDIDPLGYDYAVQDIG